MNPLLSIVIANYNYGRFIGAAIESVLGQMDARVELLVVDGGSTDDSVEVIRRYDDRIAWWVSEADKGQSDAFNKGFAHARGRYLTWLNADDVFLPGALVRILAAMEAHPEVDWFAGGTIYFSEGGSARTATVPLGNWLPRTLGVPAWMRVSGPSSFFSQRLLVRVGRVRLDLRYVMDIDLWMRFTQAGATLYAVGGYLWGFRVHEASKTSSSLTAGAVDSRFAVERVKIRRDNHVRREAEAVQLFMKRLCAVMSGGYLRRFFYLRNHRMIGV